MTNALSLNQIEQIESLLTNLDGSLKEFFDLFSLQTCKEEIWQLMMAYFSSPLDQLPDSTDERGNTMFFCKKLNSLLTHLHRISAFKTPVVLHTERAPE